MSPLALVHLATARGQLIRVMMVSAELHSTGKRASDDPLDLDQFIRCSAGPLTSRNMPRKADADADDADDSEGFRGDYGNAAAAVMTHLKHARCSAAQVWKQVGRNQTRPISADDLMP